MICFSPSKENNSVYKKKSKTNHDWWAEPGKARVVIGLQTYRFEYKFDNNTSTLLYLLLFVLNTPLTVYRMDHFTQ